MNNILAIANAAESFRVMATKSCSLSLCLIGLCVQDAYTQAATKGNSIKQLFSGKFFAFSYAHGNKCRKFYLAVRSRMLTDTSPADKEAAEKQLDAQLQAILDAGDEAPAMAEKIFGPYIEGEDLLTYPRTRKAKKLPAPCEVPSTPEPLPAPGQTHPRRERTLREWTHVAAPVEIFIRDLAPLLTRQDRDRLAEQLSALAHEMKNTKGMRPARAAEQTAKNAQKDAKQSSRSASQSRDVAGQISSHATALSAMQKNTGAMVANIEKLTAAAQSMADAAQRAADAAARSAESLAAKMESLRKTTERINRKI